jgi:hypothetical protein
MTAKRESASLGENVGGNERKYQNDSGYRG